MNKSGIQIGRIYAGALFELSTGDAAIEAVKDDLAVLAHVMADEKEFAAFCASPYFHAEYKSQLLQKLFKSKLSELTMDFLQVVSKHNRIPFLPLVAQEYEKLRDIHFGMRLVHITLAKQTSEQEIQKITEEISAALKSEIKIDVRVDASLIGGVIIRHGDMVIDNTIKRELREAVRAITSGRKNQE